MNNLEKFGAVLKSAQPDEGALEAINRLTLRPLKAEEVFVFRVEASTDQVDRDCERFTKDALGQMAELYAGRPLLRDHHWSADTQTARIFAAEVVEREGVNRLILSCYMVRTEKAAEAIAAIEGGILREVSVGVAVNRVICSVCGADQCKERCPHIPGREYDGHVCIMELDGISDVYECSLVAVPANPDAGVVKSKRYGGAEPPETPPEGQGGDGAESAFDRISAAARLEIEKIRFGGM